MSGTANAPLPPAGSWVTTASNNAVITRDELLAWLKLPHGAALRLLSAQGLPPPRFVGPGSAAAQGGALTYTRLCRWRVGDIRAWIAGRDVAAEAAVPVGVSDHKPRRYDPYPYRSALRPRVTPPITTK